MFRRSFAGSRPWPANREKEHKNLIKCSQYGFKRVDNKYVFVPFRNSSLTCLKIFRFVVDTRNIFLLHSFRDTNFLGFIDFHVSISQFCCVGRHATMKICQSFHSPSIDFAMLNWWRQWNEFKMFYSSRHRIAEVKQKSRNVGERFNYIVVERAHDWKLSMSFQGPSWSWCLNHDRA